MGKNRYLHLFPASANSGLIRRPCQHPTRGVVACSAAMSTCWCWALAISTLFGERDGVVIACCGAAKSAESSPLERLPERGVAAGVTQQPSKNRYLHAFLRTRLGARARKLSSLVAHANIRHEALALAALQGQLVSVRGARERQGRERWAVAAARRQSQRRGSRRQQRLKYADCRRRPGRP
jgi:hypothetical protein